MSKNRVGLEPDTTASIARDAPTGHGTPKHFGLAGRGSRRRPIRSFGSENEYQDTEKSIMIEVHCKYDEMVDPNTLVDHPRNCNKHPRRQLDALVEFIRHSGWRHAVVVSRLSGLIVAGHARKLAAIELGCKAPVVYQNFVNEAEERTFLAADNRLAELAEVDVEALNVEIKELEVLDIPVLNFGFDITESPIHRETDDMGETGSSPWDRVGTASDGVMFSFGDFQCRVSEESYCRFKECVTRENLEEWILENCNS